jgi:hypothetical protein
VVDFTIPVIQDGLGILTKKKLKPDKMFRLFEPFSTTVWIVVALVLVIAGVFQWLVNWITPFSGYRREKPGRNRGEITWNENIWMIFGHFLAQGKLALTS